MAACDGLGLPLVTSQVLVAPRLGAHCLTASSADHDAMDAAKGSPPFSERFDSATSNTSAGVRSDSSSAMTSSSSRSVASLAMHARR